MLPELGSFAIILSLCFALIQAICSIKGFMQTMRARHCEERLFAVASEARQSNPVIPGSPRLNAAQPRDDDFALSDAINIYSRFGQIAVLGQWAFLSIAMLILIISFLNNDMTVAYVQEHSHQLLPFIYRVGAAWGGHEGSLLLWCLILSGWTLAFNFFVDKALPQKSFTIIIATLGLISSGFITFLLFTSNPFKRLFPTQLIVGDDLTPILQDPGLIFHPPMLYLGYVGFAIGFAFAVCALIEGKLDKTWVKACRPWIILPWGFLSCGIVLGSWWAYRELGWGGWWFWDPVENASLLPWLSATALIHALIVSEKRDTFKGWTILLALITFSLSLLGTFLVRSGVLVSVHAFASDPTRGIFLLSYLTLIIGGAFMGYAYRIDCFYQAPRFQLLSRETTLLINTVILLTAVATISIGTLYPIVLDALGNEKISVGEPYFNTVFLPIILPLLFLMGLAPHLNWGHATLKRCFEKVSFTFLASFVFALISPLLFGFPIYFLTTLGIFFGIWIIVATLQYAYRQRSLQSISMIVAHIGIGILALGVTVNKSYSEETQVKMRVGETVIVAGYPATLLRLMETKETNYQTITATFKIHQHEIAAEQRIYRSHDQTLSHPGILVNGWRDFYIALGAPLGDGSWSVRLYFKPFVRWIWFGGFMLLVGGLLSLFTYQKKRELA